MWYLYIGYNGWISLKKWGQSVEVRNLPYPFLRGQPLNLLWLQIPLRPRPISFFVTSLWYCLIRFKTLFTLTRFLRWRYKEERFIIFPHLGQLAFLGAFLSPTRHSESACGCGACGFGSTFCRRPRTSNRVGTRCWAIFLAGLGSILGHEPAQIVLSFQALVWRCEGLSFDLQAQTHSFYLRVAFH